MSAFGMRTLPISMAQDTGIAGKICKGVDCPCFCFIDTISFRMVCLNNASCACDLIKSLCKKGSSTVISQMFVFSPIMGIILSSFILPLKEKTKTGCYRNSYEPQYFVFFHGLSRFPVLSLLCFYITRQGLIKHILFLYKPFQRILGFIMYTYFKMQSR